MAATSKKRFLILTIVAAVIFAGFVSLGIWQIYRLQWKLDLIAAVDARVDAPAVAAPGPDQWPAVTRQDDEYRHVTATGIYLEAAQTLVYYSTQLGAGYFVMTPLLREDGTYVLINRGFVPEGKQAPENYPAPQGEVTVEGLLRMPEDKGWLFSRDNDPADGKWYRRDVASIMRTKGLVPFAPYFIDEAAEEASGALPIGGLTVVKFRNSHLSYALTWFAMALGTAALYILVLRYERRPRAPDDEHDAD